MLLLQGADLKSRGLPSRALPSPWLSLGFSLLAWQPQPLIGWAPPSAIWSFFLSWGTAEELFKSAMAAARATGMRQRPFAWRNCMAALTFVSSNSITSFSALILLSSDASLSGSSRTTLLPLFSFIGKKKWIHAPRWLYGRRCLSRITSVAMTLAWESPSLLVLRNWEMSTTDN